MCISCRVKKNRQELLKITKRYDTKELVINPNSNVFGKSAYLCYNRECVKDALKKNKLEKSLKVVLTGDFKEKLIQNFPVV